MDTKGCRLLQAVLQSQEVATEQRELCEEKEIS